MNQTKSKENGIVMEKIVSFVIEVYKLVNEFIIKCGFKEQVFSKLKNTFYVRYNIESLIFNEETEEAIKSKLKQARQISTADKNTPKIVIDVEATVNMQGKAKIKRIFINDTPFTVIK